jgi:hypothetical protein
MPTFLHPNDTGRSVIEMERDTLRKYATRDEADGSCFMCFEFCDLIDFRFRSTTRRPIATLFIQLSKFHRAATIGWKKSLRNRVAKDVSFTKVGDGERDRTAEIQRRRQHAEAL